MKMLLVKPLVDFSKYWALYSFKVSCFIYCTTQGGCLRKVVNHVS